MKGLRRFIPPPAFLCAVTTAVVTGWLSIPPKMNSTFVDMEADQATKVDDEVSDQEIEIPFISKPNTEALLSRPLFLPGRTLVTFEAELEPEPEVQEEIIEPEVISVPPPKMSYHGFIDKNGHREALVTLPDSNTQRWVKAGIEIDGWELTHINDDFLLLTDGNSEITVKLAE